MESAIYLSIYQLTILPIPHGPLSQQNHHYRLIEVIHYMLVDFVYIYRNMLLPRTKVKKKCVRVYLDICNSGKAFFFFINKSKKCVCVLEY